ncbi:hypothetical protein HMN09_00730100 [Mycena chlorophos]|uniref:F-box domain-containing protein n=1 Tax=Mycena chlorophos TaxID=658473 RepID=A0A8H6SUR8_MYCCL|nr:hypothetical protein HMN09_00730100 [Mycena chlorophos]
MLLNANELPNKIWAAVIPFLKGPQVAPIDRLPNDLLAEVFMHTLCFNGFGSSTERSRLPLEPLTVSHVSRRWRSTALSHSALWSTIWLDRPRLAHLHMLELWLERSQSAKLVIYLRQAPPNSQFSDPNEYELTEQILNRLRAELHRWYRITLFFAHGPQNALLLLPQDRTAAPLLSHVHLATNELWDRPSRIQAETTLHSYASVKSLVVHQSTLQIHVDWNNLSELDTNQVGSPVANYMAVLKLCRSLTRAEFRVVPDRPDAPFVRPSLRVGLPNLASLTLHLDHTDAGPLFDCLVLPVLQNLVLRYARSPHRSNDPNALRLLLARSGPSCILKRFSLQDNPRTRDPNAAYHLAFLHSPQMAGLIELFLQVDLCDAVLRFLTLGDAEDGTPRNLPDLLVLSLSDLKGDHLEDLELYRMVVSRLGAGESLREAYFKLCLKGHSDSRVLPLLFERCRERIELKVYLATCEDAHSKSGWYKSAPIPGGYLTDAL